MLVLAVQKTSIPRSARKYDLLSTTNNFWVPGSGLRQPPANTNDWSLAIATQGVRKALQATYVGLGHAPQSGALMILK